MESKALPTSKPTMSLLTAFLDLMANLLGIRRAKVEASQTPAMKANAAASTDAVQGDRADKLVENALKGEPKSLEDIRREVSE